MAIVSISLKSNAPARQTREQKTFPTPETIVPSHVVKTDKEV